MVYNKMYCKQNITITRYVVNLAIVHIQLQLKMGLRPLTDSYYCTAVRPQFNDQIVRQISQPVNTTICQYSGRNRPTQLHSREQLLVNIIKLQTLRRAKQHVPQDYKINTLTRKAKC